MWDIRFSKLWKLRLWFSEIQHHIILHVVINISEELVATFCTEDGGYRVIYKTTQCHTPKRVSVLIVWQLNKWEFQLFRLKETAITELNRYVQSYGSVRYALLNKYQNEILIKFYIIIAMSMFLCEYKFRVSNKTTNVFLLSSQEMQDTEWQININISQFIHSLLWWRTRFSFVTAAACFLGHLMTLSVAQGA